jgi:hypothetical protein
MHLTPGVESALGEHYHLELLGHHWKMGLSALVGGSSDDAVVRRSDGTTQRIARNSLRVADRAGHGRSGAADVCRSRRHACTAAVWVGAAPAAADSGRALGRSR